MRTLLLWALVGLIGAGLVHGASLLILPIIADKTAYDRLADTGEDARFHILAGPGPGESLVPFEDPEFVVAACRYDLDNGALRVRAPLPPTYGSIVFYTRFGQVYYALTDRATPTGSVDVVALSQTDIGAAGLGEADTLRIVSPTRHGFVLLRLYVPNRGMLPAIRALAESARCEALPRE